MIYPTRKLGEIAFSVLWFGLWMSLGLYIDLIVSINIIGILFLFASTCALASSIFKNWAANEYYISYSGQKQWYKFWGYLFGICSYQDAMNHFHFTGNKQEDDKRKDTNAPIRGIIWAFIGTLILITSLINAT